MLINIEIIVMKLLLFTVNGIENSIYIKKKKNMTIFVDYFAITAQGVFYSVNQTLVKLVFNIRLQRSDTHIDLACSTLRKIV